MISEGYGDQELTVSMNTV